MPRSQYGVLVWLSVIRGPWPVNVGGVKLLTPKCCCETDGLSEDPLFAGGWNWSVMKSELDTARAPFQ